MWNGYNPTKKERELIEGAYSYIARCHMSSDYELDRLMKNERRGYGNRNDAIPTIGAKALCVRWFFDGVQKPDALLRDYYSLRPAAAWLIGKGAERSQGAPAINMTCLENAVAAHEAAFKRMIDKDHIALKAALEAARKPAAEIVAEAF